MKWYSKGSLVLFLVFAFLLTIFTASYLMGIQQEILMWVIQIVAMFMIAFLFIGIASFWYKRLTGQKTEGPKISWLVVIGLIIAATTLPLIALSPAFETIGKQTIYTGQPIPFTLFLPAITGVIIIIIGIYQTLKVKKS